MAKYLLFSAPQVLILLLLCKALVSLYTKFPSLLTVGLVYCCGVGCKFPYIKDPLSIIIVDARERFFYKSYLFALLEYATLGVC